MNINEDTMKNRQVLTWNQISVMDHIDRRKAALIN